MNKGQTSHHPCNSVPSPSEFAEHNNAHSSDSSSITTMKRSDDTELTKRPAGIRKHHKQRRKPAIVRTGYLPIQASVYGDVQTLSLALQVRELRGKLSRNKAYERDARRSDMYLLTFPPDVMKIGETILYYAYDKHRASTKGGQRAFRVSEMTKIMLDAFNVKYIVHDSKVRRAST